MMLFPELFMLLFSVFFLLLSLCEKKAYIFPLARLLALIGLVVTFLSAGASGELFSGAYRVDLFSQIFKCLLVTGFCLVVFMLEKNDDIEDDFFPDFFMFLGFSTLCLLMLFIYVELIYIFIILED